MIPSLFPNAASSIAAEYDYLFWSLVVVCGLVSLGIACFVVYAALRYHRRSEDQLPPQTTGSMRLEILWSAIPLVLFMGMFGWGATLYFDIERPPNNAAPIYVIARQWMWKAQYVDGRREINELHVPVGVPVKLIMTSQDVIHSFFVPAFPRQAGRTSEPLHHHLVPTFQAGEISPLLRGILRHQAFWNDRLDLRNGPPAVSAVAFSRSGGRVARVHGRKNVPPIRMRQLPPLRRPGPMPEPQGPISPPGPALRTARRSPPTNPTSGNRSSIREPRSWRVSPM